jgi:hypothetical protein
VKSYLSEDNPEFWEKVKDHYIKMPEDWEGETPLYCHKCGKQAVQRIDMLWVCPIAYDIPNKYISAG